jgi:hypothetical protein
MLKGDSMPEPTILYDREGNTYKLVGSQEPDKLIIEGQDGTQHVFPVTEINGKYSFHRPEVLHAMEEISRMLMSGELTVEDIRRLTGKK